MVDDWTWVVASGLAGLDDRILATDGTLPLLFSIRMPRHVHDRYQYPFALLRAKNDNVCGFLAFSCVGWDVLIGHE